MLTAEEQNILLCESVKIFASKDEKQIEKQINKINKLTKAEEIETVFQQIVVKSLSFNELYQLKIIEGLNGLTDQVENKYKWLIKVNCARNTPKNDRIAFLEEVIECLKKGENIPLTQLGTILAYCTEIDRPDLLDTISDIIMTKK